MLITALVIIKSLSLHSIVNGYVATKAMEMPSHAVNGIMSKTPIFAHETKSNT